MRDKMKSRQRRPRLPYSSRVAVDGELIEEPQLLFHQNVPEANPKVGLTQMGPVGRDLGAHRREILVDIVGTGQTIQQMAEWLERCKSSIPARAGKLRQSPAFPGFSGESQFASEFKVTSRYQGKVTATEIANILATRDKTAGFENAVNVFVGKFRSICEGEDPPDIIVCSLPDEIVEYCAEASTEFLETIRESPRSPQERLFRRMARLELATGQLHLVRKLFGEPGSAANFFGRNLRRALKALAMPLGRPIQLVTSKLFTDTAEGQDPATKAWNLCVALYYKSGGLPWRLEKFSRDTCFVGVSFFRNLGEKSPVIHTSVAQVFSGEGDAVVLRGRKFEWKHEWERSPHLGHDDAANLISLALAEYRKVSGIIPRRVVIHKTSAFWPLERDGFVEGLASASISEYDLVNLQQLGIRFFREGRYPPLRGTYCRINGKKHVLYTLGYIPYLGTYPHPYVPLPWELCSNIGDTAPRRLFEEVLSLTKMNFNNAAGADSEPITLRFARKVGEILSYIPEGKDIQPSYRFYM